MLVFDSSADFLFIILLLNLGLDWLISDYGTAGRGAAGYPAARILYAAG